MDTVIRIAVNRDSVDRDLVTFSKFVKIPERSEIDSGKQRVHLS